MPNSTDHKNKLNCINNTYQFSITILLLVLISVLGHSLTENKSHMAFADSFVQLPVRVQHSPTVCAIEPPPDTNFPSIGNQLLEETQYSIIDWNTKLNQGLGKHPVWNISLIKVLLGQQDSFDYSKCDITIQYLPKPQTNGMEFVLTGVTIPNLETGKTNIEVYYSDVQPNWIEKEWWENGTNYYTYVNEPYYTGNQATTTQIDSTTRHELGHALGLGHFIVPNEELKKIVDGIEDMPSIMIPLDTALGVKHFDITQLDISQIKSIYGNSGFDNQMSSSQTSKRAHILGTDKSSYQTGDMMKLSIDSSQLGNDTSGEILVIDSNNHLKDDIGISKSNSTIYLNDITDKNGKYWIEFFSPDNKVYDFTDFTVSNNINTPITNHPAQSHTTKPLPPDQVIVNATSETSNGTLNPTTSYDVQSQIPSWIKNNAKWWSESSIEDTDFVKGIQYLIQQGVFKVPQTQQTSTPSQKIPSWIKNNAGWWANDQISDDDFVKGIQWLIANGIITV